MNTKTINVQVLALLGDAVFSLYVREELIKIGFNHSDVIQRESAKYISAKGQASILKNLIDDKVLTDEELATIKRGRNNKRESHPKNTDIITYKLSTGFEALLGELYINNRNRLKEILNKIEVK